MANILVTVTQQGDPTAVTNATVRVADLDARVVSGNLGYNSSVQAYVYANATVGNRYAAYARRDTYDGLSGLAFAVDPATTLSVVMKPR